jgi:hypothetical protein
MDRPMNEYESALFSALMVLTRSVADGSTNRAILAVRFRECAQIDTEASQKSAAATLEMFARTVEEDQYHIPRPPFFVIDGGKNDDPSN